MILLDAVMLGFFPFTGLKGILFLILGYNLIMVADWVSVGDSGANEVWNGCIVAQDTAQATLVIENDCTASAFLTGVFCWCESVGNIIIIYRL